MFYIYKLCKTVWRYFRKLNKELTYDPAIPLLGMHPDKTLIKMIYVPLIAKTWKQPKCPLQMNGLRCDTYIQWNITHP